MSNYKFLSRRTVVIAGGVFAIILIGLCFAFEPVTRIYVAQDDFCTYCHGDREYDPTVRLSYSKQHPAELKDGKEAALCVDCHLPKGFLATTYAYTHFISITDLFGNFRDRAGERVGAWTPPSAVRAYRVRQRLLEHDGSTCRGCHIESEIVFSKPRGETAHIEAQQNKETCIECHTNLVHRYVEERLAKADTGDDEGSDEATAGDEFEDEFSDDLEGGEEEEEEIL